MFKIIIAVLFTIFMTNAVYANSFNEGYDEGLETGRIQCFQYGEIWSLAHQSAIQSGMNDVESRSFADVNAIEISSHNGILCPTGLILSEMNKECMKTSLRHCGYIAGYVTARDECYEHGVIFGFLLAGTLKQWREKFGNEPPHELTLDRVFNSSLKLAEEHAFPCPSGINAYKP